MRAWKKPGWKKESLVLEVREKGKAATQDCNVSASMFLRHTAVYWTRWSSSRLPCGLGLELPNLFMASSTWRHEAVSGFIPLSRLRGYITVVVYMIMSVKIFLCDSNMITRVSEASPCIYYLHFNIRVHSIGRFPSETCPIPRLERSPLGYYRPERV